MTEALSAHLISEQSTFWTVFWSVFKWSRHVIRTVFWSVFKWSRHVIRLIIRIPDISDHKTDIFVQFSNNHLKTQTISLDILGPFEYQTFPVFRWLKYYSISGSKICRALSLYPTFASCWTLASARRTPTSVKAMTTKKDLTTWDQKMETWDLPFQPLDHHRAFQGKTFLS